jgi:uncharacterized protein (TIGR00730 family)
MPDPAPEAAPPPDPLAKAPLAYENPAFLHSPDGRIIRILAEYSEPLAHFRRERIQDTVVFFGSARFRSLKEATTEAEVETARYCEDARRLAFLLTQWSVGLNHDRHRFVVTTGGGPGIMEAANRGAFEAGGKSIGLNIQLPFEQTPNRYITPSLNLEFHYFFMRKYWFAYLAKALVVFPGGFGTIDEMFEILTLVQTNKLSKKITVLLYGSSYWKSVLDFDVLVEKGAVAARDRDLLQWVDTPEQAFELLKEGLTQNHLIPEAGRQANTGDEEQFLRPEIAGTL